MTSTSVITISKWSDTFENADMRKRQRLKSFHAPSGVDSRGLVNLLCRTPDQQAALAAFGVFQLICQLSATLPADHRGRLIHSDSEPMTLDYLSRLFRIEICHLAAGLELLASEGVGWILWDAKNEQSATVCRQSASFVQEEEEEEEEEEGTPLPPDGGSVGSGELFEEDKKKILTKSKTEAQVKPVDLQAAWNTLPAQFPKIKALSSARKRAFRQRLADPLWVENWRKVIEGLPSSEFHAGTNDRGWVATIDWFLRPDSVLKFIERNGADEGSPPEGWEQVYRNAYGREPPPWGEVEESRRKLVAGRIERSNGTSGN